MYLGPYVFLTSFGTYLLSKEWYILEDEFYTGTCLLSIILFTSYKLGPKLGAYLDKEIDSAENDLNSDKEEAIAQCNTEIQNIEKEKWSAEGQLMIYDIKKQNILMQLEANYRENLAIAYTEVMFICNVV